MDDLLTRMAVASAARAAAARMRRPESDLRRRIADLAPVAPLRLHPAGFDIIAEIKLRAPSAGRLIPHGADAPGADPPGLVRNLAAAYEAGGAAALSVLTEPSEFDGDLSHLMTASGAVALPVMRKDFLVDTYQVVEARAAGSGGVLLIVRLLDDGRLEEMIEACAGLGLFALVEAFDERDVDRAVRAIETSGGRQMAPLLLGVNARDLRTLSVDAARLERLAPLLPAGIAGVAESGLEDAGDAARAASLGYDLALVGSALVRSPDPRSALVRMLEAGRRAKVSRLGGGG